ncbi:MAG: PilZ domain-containing protein [Candidatus Scalindua sp.]
MKYFYRGIDRRSIARLELTQTIMILNHEAKSKNISSGGVYCEVETDAVELFLPGKNITIEIFANAHTPRLPGKIVRVIGRGVIMRTDEIGSAEFDNGKRTKKLGIALKLLKGLKVMHDSGNY